MSTLAKALRSTLATAGAILILAGLSYAKSYKIQVIYPTLVGISTHLKPGNYRVQVLANGSASHLAFFNRNGRRVASVPVTVKRETRKNQYTEVDYNKLAQNEHAITEIRPRGQSAAFMISTSGKAMPSGKKAEAALKGGKSKS